MRAQLLASGEEVPGELSPTVISSSARQASRLGASSARPPRHFQISLDRHYIRSRDGGAGARVPKSVILVPDSHLPTKCEPSRHCLLNLMAPYRSRTPSKQARPRRIARKIARQGHTLCGTHAVSFPGGDPPIFSLATTTSPHGVSASCPLWCTLFLCFCCRVPPPIPHLGGDTWHGGDVVDFVTLQHANAEIVS